MYRILEIYRKGPGMLQNNAELCRMLENYRNALEKTKTAYQNIKETDNGLYQCSKFMNNT